MPTAGALPYRGRTRSRQNAFGVHGQPCQLWIKRQTALSYVAVRVIYRTANSWVSKPQCSLRASQIALGQHCGALVDNLPYGLDLSAYPGDEVRTIRSANDPQDFCVVLVLRLNIGHLALERAQSEIAAGQDANRCRHLVIGDFDQAPDQDRRPNKHGQIEDVAAATIAQARKPFAKLGGQYV